ncbi:DNA polymerase III subunit beta [compost metagenome]
MSFASSLYFVGVLSGKYLEIDRAIPKTFGLEVVVDRREFLEAIERANFVSREASENDVLLAINDDRITIVAKTGKGKAVESLSFIKKTGEGINIALKAKNAIDALKAIKSDKVIVKFNAANTPVIIEPEDGTLSLYLIQPFLMREKYKEWISGK